jgi:hypothetical protein
MTSRRGRAQPPAGAALQQHFHSGASDMENTNRFRLKALNFGLVAFLITLPVLIGIYTLAT